MFKRKYARPINVVTLPTLRFVVIGVSFLVTPFTATALPSYIDNWRAEYPNSSSVNEGCQMCHVLSDGGEPWNAYGRDIRNEFRKLNPNTRTIEQAFRAVESFNSDNDEAGLSNLSEINAGAQPGWRSGRVNLAYDRDDNVVGAFEQPVTIDPFLEKLSIVDYPVELTEVASGLTSPLAGVVSPIAGLRNQLFIVDQIGLIWRLDLVNGTKTSYLDVQDRLIQLGAFEPGGYDERGLLGFAFHPQFAENGLAYLYLSAPATVNPDFTTLSQSDTANHQSVVLEITVSNPSEQLSQANLVNERELLRVDQPQFNHNGGDLQFDNEGLLYIAFGDGGNSDDEGVGHGESGNGGDPSNPLGSILRVDPLGRNSANGQYGIPPGNPFINTPDRLGEIYAYGFRNPWKLSFDSDGQLYAADVGQGDVEEINQVQKGMHYGWPFRQGSFFFEQNGELNGIITRSFPNNLPPEQLIDPLLEYDHDEGISVSGGHVYRGSGNPSLAGSYVFADFQKRLFVGDLNNGGIDAMNLSPDIFVFSIAEDANSELYILGNATALTSGTSGKVYKLTSTLAAPEEEPFCVTIKAKNENVSIVCL